MATKVCYKPNGNIYLLLGVGFGAYKATRPSLFLGDWVPTEDEDEMEMVALCDARGKIGWASSADVQVVEIDGAAPQDLLG